MRPVYWIVFAMGSLLQVSKEILLSQVNSNAGYNMYHLRFFRAAERICGPGVRMQHGPFVK